MVQVIWNSVTRSELMRFVDQQKAHKGPDGKYTLAEATTFKYKALSEELQVGLGRIPLLL
jgi:DnaJ family protein C protein 13